MVSATISEADVMRYREDGAVCLDGAAGFNRDWWPAAALAPVPRTPASSRCPISKPSGALAR